MFRASPVTRFATDATVSSVRIVTQVTRPRASALGAPTTRDTPASRTHQRTPAAIAMDLIRTPELCLAIRSIDRSQAICQPPRPMIRGRTTRTDELLGPSAVRSPSKLRDGVSRLMAIGGADDMAGRRAICRADVPEEPRVHAVRDADAG